MEVADGSSWQDRMIFCYVEKEGKRTSRHDFVIILFLEHGIDICGFVSFISLEK